MNMMQKISALGILCFAFFSVCAYAGVNTWTLIGPAGGDTTDVTFDPMDGQIAYAVTASGLYKSQDAGAILM
jgi:hypothetical protein